MSISRRAVIASALPFLAEPAPTPPKVVVVGGHPGDPECGCGGTIARFSALGHPVTILYLNRGEGYCGGQPLARCGDIRILEAQSACRILNATPLFAGQYDGRAIIDAPHYDAFAAILKKEEPALVFTHWPIDRHRDHCAASLLTHDAWLKAGKSFALYYYEVAEDTMMFSPTEFVDISSVEAKRHAACYAHVSQQPDKWYPKQVEITKRRGEASGFSQAEGFARHAESRSAVLPK